MRKLLLVVGVLISLAVAGERLYKFINDQNTKPLADVGECLAVPVDKESTSAIICMVEENKDKSTLLSCDFGMFSVHIWAENKEMREERVEKVPCP